MKFDPKKNYMQELLDEEKWDGEYPLLSGLRRLAHERGITMIDSVVNATPTRESPIASVTVTVAFVDGASYAASADAAFKAHSPPFNNHLVALADSKAEARAYRRAFNIAKASKEECGDMPMEGDVDGIPIAESQIEGIKNMAKVKGLTVAESLNLIGEQNAIETLTRKQGREVIKAINKYRPKKSTSKGTK